MCEVRLLVSAFLYITDVSSVLKDTKTTEYTNTVEHGGHKSRFVSCVGCCGRLRSVSPLLVHFQSASVSLFGWRALLSPSHIKTSTGGYTPHNALRSVRPVPLCLVSTVLPSVAFALCCHFERPDNYGSKLEQLTNQSQSALSQSINHLIIHRSVSQ